MYPFFQFATRSGDAMGSPSRDWMGRSLDGWFAVLMATVRREQAVRKLCSTRRPVQSCDMGFRFFARCGCDVDVDVGAWEFCFFEHKCKYSRGVVEKGM